MIFRLTQWKIAQTLEKEVHYANRTLSITQCWQTPSPYSSLKRIPGLVIAQGIYQKCKLRSRSNR